MALNRSNKYPGRFLAPTAARPQGAFKNRTSPTAQDGSYLEADWANDWDGFFARILTVAGITPNGNVDDGSASQLYDALLAAVPGRLVAVKTITSSSTYTKTPGVNKIIVRMVGGGGAGGGTAPTNASQIASGVGGNGATYSESTIIDVTNVSTVPVIVGIGGNGVAGATGSDGTASSFGTYLIAPGGAGGGVGSAGAAGTAGPDQGSGTPGSGTALSLTIPGGGGTGPFNISIISNGTKSGRGGDSMYGTGGGAINGTLAPRAGSGYGAGGSGNAAGPGALSAIAGGKGSNGIVIVEEYI